MKRPRMGNVAGSNVQIADRMVLFTAFDSLPPLSRAALRDCIPNWDAREAVEAIRQMMVEGCTLDDADRRMAALIYNADENNMRRFAKESGCYSHLLARATIVRYHDGRRY